MAKKERAPRPAPAPRPAKVKRPSNIPKFQLLLGAGCLGFAANSYFSYVTLPRGVMEGFLIILAAYLFVRAAERTAYKRRADILKRHL